MNRTEETLTAATIALLAEGIAVALFCGMVLVWAAIMTGGV